MEYTHEIEVEVEGGIVCGEVVASWTIEDNSFDHAFGTEKVFDVALEEDEGFDIEHLRFFPYDNEESDGEVLTQEQKAEIESRLSGILKAPNFNTVACDLAEI
jgi:hypothetical protein